MSEQVQSMGGMIVHPLRKGWVFRTARRGEHDSLFPAARRRRGLDKVTLSEAQQAIRKHRPYVFLDLSGIAKGYGVDRVAELMTAHGIEHYMVEIGGSCGGLERLGLGCDAGCDKPCPERLARLQSPRKELL